MKMVTKNKEIQSNIHHPSFYTFEENLEGFSPDWM